MTLSAAGGNVNATNLAGNLQLDTGGGDLTANGLTGTLQIATEGGNVRRRRLGRHRHHAGGHRWRRHDRQRPDR